MRYKFVTAVWNSEPWIERCLQSLESQQGDFDVCVVVDKGEDRTDEIAAKFCEERHWDYIIREEKSCTLKNQLDAIEMLYEGVDDDVVVWVDGDDWLPHNKVLKRLTQAYETGNVLMTYGSYASVPFSKTCAPAQPYPQEVINTGSYRKFARKGQGILWNHLRTVSYHLLNQLEESDFRGERGQYLEAGPDATIMFPCLELSKGAFEFIPDVLLNYNSENPQSEWRKAPKQVNADHDWVLTRPKKV